MEIVSQTCVSCKCEKPISDFPKAKQNKSGYRGQCKTCCKAWMAGYYERNREKAAVAGRESYKRNRERKLYTSRRWSEQNPDRVKDNLLKYSFGIGLDDYQRMLSEQDGKCAICRTDSNRGRAFAVDHDHATGEIRGLLCSDCNTGIGLLKDEPELLAKAIQYLQSHK
jgi:hypothetical protein